MPKLSSYKPEQRIFALFIGRSKSGKSSAAATFPKPRFLDFDGRIAGTLWTQKIGVNPDAVEYEYYPPEKASWATVDDGLEKLGIQLFTDRTSAPQTLVPDSITAMLRLFVTDALSLMKGNTVGNKDEKKLRLEGPADYKYESNACFQVFDFLRSLPINVICTAHIIDKYGKADPDNDTKIQETIVVGEKLSVRDKLGENLLVYFNEVYRFERREARNGETKHFVKFYTDMASSTLGMPRGELDITGKNFYKDIWLPNVEQFQSSIKPQEPPK